MAKRSVCFEKGNYYHIFNRGVDRRNIFIEENDVFYFFHRLIDLNSIINFGHENKRNLLRNKEKIKNKSKLVSIVSYCFLPNHFHLVLKEVEENGISRFMQKIGTSYSKYFNKKYSRSGSLFQGKFKAKQIDRNLSLLNLSVYVNLNYKHHGLKLENPLVKSSILEYLGKEKFDTVCKYTEVLEEAGGIDSYINFLKKTETIFIEKKSKDKNKKYLLKEINFEELEN